MQEQEHSLEEPKTNADAAPEVPPQRNWQPTAPQNTVPPQPQQFSNNNNHGVPPQSQPPQPQRPVNNYVPPQNYGVPPQPQRPVNGYIPPQGYSAPPQFQRPVNGYVPPQGYGIPPQHPGNGTVPPLNYGISPQTQYTAGGHVPPQMTEPETADEEEQAKAKDRKAAFWLRIVAALIIVLLGYCIVSDIVLYRTGGNQNTAAYVTENENAAVPTGSGTGAEVVIQQQEKPELDPTKKDVNADGTYTVEGVAAAVRPSIVEIYTYGDNQNKQLNGTGSGIILSEDGYIITNAHVITGGKSFSVITEDETTYPAEVVGSDAKTDLAVIKVDADQLPAATIGNSDEVVLGESVVAIGNPAGLSGTVTNGIVSGLNRQIRSDGTGFDMNCIQTNAAISPGNSGGALVNMYGQVIGITSSKYVSASYEGLGFAITINDVIPIVEELIEQGYVGDRVRIGITFIALEAPYVQQEFAMQIGMDEVPEDLTGLWISEISQDCDIANTKLAVDDVIIEAEGVSVKNYDDLSAAIADLKAGDEVEARCRRYDKSGNYEEFTICFQLMEDTSGNF